MIRSIDHIVLTSSDIDKTAFLLFGSRYETGPFYSR